MMFWIVITFLMLSGDSTADDITQALTKDLFSERFIDQLVIFACWDYSERVDFCRSLMSSGMQISYNPIDQNIMDMERILNVNYYKIGVVLDLDCAQSESVLEKLSTERIPYNESYSWLLITKAEVSVIALLRGLPLTIESEVTLAIRSGNSYILHDVYNPSYRHGGDLNVTFMGRWDPEIGLRIELTQYKYRRRGNLRGMILNVATAATQPAVPDLLTYMSTPTNPHFDSMTRFNFALVLQLRDYYNFTMNLTRTASWGYLRNGRFDGLVGEMIAGRVDFGAIPLQFKEERIDVVEYTVATWIARPCFIFRHPKKSEVRNGFLRPFTEEVWIVIVFIALVLWLLLCLTVKLELLVNERTPISTMDIHPVSETALVVIAAISQQGLTDTPHFISGRVVFISLFLWGCLLYQFYSASVVGSILAPPPRYINTLQDLLDSSMLVGIENISYNIDFFATTTDPVALELYKRKVAPSRNRKKEAYFNPHEGLKKVQKGGFAFHVDVATAYKIITDTFSEDEICDLVEIQLFPPKPVSTATAKHSPFKKMVTYGLRQIMERGLAERQRHIWHHRRPRCPEGHSSIPVPVSLPEFCPALFLLLIGIGASGIVLWIEFKRKRNHLPCFHEKRNIDSSSETRLRRSQTTADQGPMRVAAEFEYSFH